MLPVWLSLGSIQHSGYPDPSLTLPEGLLSWASLPKRELSFLQRTHPYEGDDWKSAAKRAKRLTGHPFSASTWRALNKVEISQFPNGKLKVEPSIGLGSAVLSMPSRHQRLFPLVSSPHWRAASK